MARTGEKRKTDQPFHVDRLPVSVQMAICRLKNNDGLSWQQIEDLSALPKGTDGAFVEWEKLPTDVLELFPKRRIPHFNMHRWFDVRKRQVAAETLQKSAQAREIAEAFAGSIVEKGNDAVIFAARDTIMGMLAEDSTALGRAKAAAGLIALAEVMQSARANDIKERRVALGERALQIKLDEIKRKAGELLKDAQSQDGETPVLSREQVIDRVKEIYGVA